MEILNLKQLEQTAVELQALLKMLSCVDGDSKHISELPLTIGIAAEMADTLYCAIANMRGCEICSS